MHYNNVASNYKTKIPNDLLKLTVIYKCNENICFQSTEFYYVYQIKKETRKKNKKVG